MCSVAGSGKHGPADALSTRLATETAALRRDSSELRS